jgi:hypothetical protein
MAPARPSRSSNGARLFSAAVDSISYLFFDPKCRTFGCLRRATPSMPRGRALRPPFRTRPTHIVSFRTIRIKNRRCQTSPVFQRKTQRPRQAQVISDYCEQRACVRGIHGRSPESSQRSKICYRPHVNSRVNNAVLCKGDIYDQPSPFSPQPRAVRRRYVPERCRSCIPNTHRTCALGRTPIRLGFDRLIRPAAGEHRAA